MSSNALLLMPMMALGSLPLLAAPSQPAKAKAAPLQRPAPKAVPTEVVLQAQSEGATIRLRRARWANSEELLVWKGRGKQLTLWFDALLDPDAALPKDAVPSDNIVNVQLLDKDNRAVQVFPVEPLRLWQRSSLPYVPAKADFKAEGQSVWRVQPFNPDFKAVKLQVEWLQPGHPFERKTLPPSLLGSKAQPSEEARRWLRVLEMELPQEKIEYGAVQKDSEVTVVQGANARFKAVLSQWRKSSWRTTSGKNEGATGQSLNALLLLETSDPKQGTLLKDSQVLLTNDAGLSVAMTSRIGEASEWFTPSGKPLKAHQRTISGSFNLPADFDPNSPLRLKVVARNDANVRYNGAGQRLTTLEDQERDGNASSLELPVPMPEPVKAPAK